MAACVSAQGLPNPSFELDLNNWTAYEYSSLPDGDAGLPWVANIGSGGFNLLTPPAAPNGEKVCGIQSSDSSRNGGVSQGFVCSGGKATISVTARAYSEPSNNGCRVRMGLANFPTADRSDVVSWTTFPWGNAWNTLSLTVPGPGDYTLFIEALQPDKTATMSTLWDNVVFAVLPEIVVLSGPSFEVPGDPPGPDTKVRITWTTDVVSTTRVDYGPDSGYGQSFEDLTPTTLHVVLISGLTHSSTYHFCAKSTAEGRSDWVSADTVVETPIQFRDIGTRLTADGVNTIVSWKTDVPTTSQVEYGYSTTYGTSRPEPEDAVLKTEHEVTLSGLDEDKEYHYRVWGRNNSGGYTDAHSDDHLFLSLPPPRSQLENGSFENGHGTQSHSLYPWVQYTVDRGGYHPIDGLVGPYPKGGPAHWPNHPPESPPPAIQARDGSYFVGAASQLYFKNGGVFQRLQVNPNQDYTFSASFATHRLGGTANYTRIRLGIDPNGGTDPLSSGITWWSTYSASNDEKWHRAGVTAKSGASGIATVFLDIWQVYGLQWHVVAVDSADFGLTPVRTIGALKASQTGLGAILENKIVTHVFPENVEIDDNGYQLVYIEEADRSAGIAVLLDANGYDFPEAGNKLTLTGSLVPRNGEATVVATNWTVDHDAYTLPNPIGVSQRVLGGSTVNQPGLYWQAGPCNVGLRVRVYGRVNGSDSGGEPGMDTIAYVDDGTGIMDGNIGEVKGVSVFCVGSPYGVVEGDFIGVTGVLTVQRIDPNGWPNDWDDYYVYTVHTGAAEDWNILYSPLSVTGLTATAGGGQVALAWTNPATPDWTGTMIRYNTTGYPTNPTDGFQIYDGAQTSYTHTGLTAGVTYYYCAYGHNDVWRYAPAAKASAKVSWDVMYEGNELPSAASPAWTREIGLESLAHIDSGTLHVDDNSTAAGSQIVWYRNWGASSSTGMTIEARMRCDLLNYLWDINQRNVELNDGTYSVCFRLRPGRIDAIGSSAPYHSLDGTAWHTYRFTLKNGTFNAYLDGGSTPILTGTGTTPSSNDIRMGARSNAGKQSIYFDYLYYTAAGAYPP